MIIAGGSQQSRTDSRKRREDYDEFDIVLLSFILCSRAGRLMRTAAGCIH